MSKKSRILFLLILLALCSTCLIFTKILVVSKPEVVENRVLGPMHAPLTPQEIDKLGKLDIEKAIHDTVIYTLEKDQENVFMESVIYTPGDVKDKENPIAEAVGPTITNIRKKNADYYITKKNSGDLILQSGDESYVYYKIAVGTTLRPDGKCIAETYYYNTETKASSSYYGDLQELGAYSANSPVKEYTCKPGQEIDGYYFPMISTERTITKSNIYSIDSPMQNAGNSIKNNLYDQIYNLQKYPYTLAELDTYGKALANITPTCSIPLYNGRPLLYTGGNAGGCSPTYWWTSLVRFKYATDELDYGIHKALISLLTDPHCEKDYVAHYLSDLAARHADFDPDDFIRHLSCARKVTLGETEWGSH